MPIEQLKIDDNKAENIRLEMEKIDSLKKDVAKQTDKTAIDVIKGLQPTQLATFIDAQFKKDANTYKSLEEMQDNSFYTFIVQAGLDAASTDGRYENLLLGKDGKYGVDDNYGSRTRAAVRQFQTDACFDEKDIDGVVGPKTMEALVKVLKGEIKLNSTEPVITGVEVYDESKDIQAYTISIFGEKKELQLNKVWRDKLDYIAKNFGKDGDISPVIYKVFDNFKVDDKGNLISAPLLRSKFATTYGLNINTSFLHQIDFTKIAKNETPAISNTVVGDSTKATYSKEKINQDMLDTTLILVGNLFTGNALTESNTKIANGDKKIEQYLKDNKITFQSNNNPNIYAKFTNNKTGFFVTGTSINVHSILQDNKLNKDAVYTQLNKFIIETIVKNEETEKKNKILNNNKEAVAKIRGMSRDLNTLFPDKKDDITYISYFNDFENSKVKIDDDEDYTKLDGTKLKFDLDNKSYDKSWNKNRTIEMSLITNAEGKLDNAKFLAKLKTIVATAVANKQKDV